MTKSATDVMQEIIFSAALDSIVALKAASKGLPNSLLRDLSAVHENTTFPDLPKALQTSIAASVRAAFARLHKEGYSISGGPVAPHRNPPSNRDATDQVPRQRQSPAKRGGSDARRTPRDGGRSGRKPRP